MGERSGYRTRQRETILSCLKARGAEHITVAEIMALLRARGATVGQTTVYRTLDKLADEGLVVKHAGSGGQPACFQYADCGGDGAAHYHLVCVDCGQMLHVQCEYLNEMTGHLLEHHQFSINPYKTVIYGLCRRCAAAKG